MFEKGSVLCALFVCGLLGSVAAQSCKTCMSNGAYCLDSQNYYICPDGKNPSNTTKLTCAAGQVCTNAKAICVASNALNATVQSVCASSAACGRCGATDTLTCVTKTQYTLCANTALLVACDTGEICSTDAYHDYGSICAPECALTFLGIGASCSNTDTTTTEVPPTTSGIDSLITQCTKQNTTSPTSGTYFQMGNCYDTTCQSYIYCQQYKGAMDAALMNCKANYFFNPTTKKCVTPKPTGCAVTCK